MESVPRYAMLDQLDGRNVTRLKSNDTSSVSGALSGTNYYFFNIQILFEN